MTVEDVNFISDLDPTRPRGSDKISLGDDHIRNIKRSIKSTFPNVDGEVKPNEDELNTLVGIDISQTLEERLSEGADQINDINTELDGVVKTTGDQEIYGQKDFMQELGARRVKIGDTQTVYAAGHCGLHFSTNTDGNGMILGTLGDGSITAGNGLNLGRPSTTFNKAYIKTIFSAQADFTGACVANNLMTDRPTDGPFFKAKQGDDETLISHVYDGVLIQPKLKKLTVDGDLYADNIVDQSSDISELQDAVAELQDQIGKSGGGMITVVQQPATAGNFEVKGTDQTYKADVAIGSSQSATLEVPDGKVFCFEYMFGVAGTGGSLRVDVDQIYIDGVRLYSTQEGYLQYSESGGPIWPGDDRGPIIKVKEKIEVKGMYCSVISADLFIAGFFAEA